MNINKKILVVTLSIFIFVFNHLGVTIASEVNNPYFHRIINGKSNRDVLILERRIEKELPYFSSKLSIPVLNSATESDLFSQLNEMFFEGVTYFAREVEALAESYLQDFKESRGYLPKYDVVVGFEVPYNSGGLLSINVHFYQYTGGAHGISFIETVNLDLTTGRILEYKDLFNTSEVEQALIDSIQATIDNAPFDYFITTVDKTILDQIQSFYLKQGQLVVYFDLYQIAPYSTGIPKFVVDLTQLVK